jgi:OOP family OmpA-OmpF porin
MKAAVAATVLALGTTAAQAENWYVLGAVGQSKFKEVDTSDLTASESASSTDMAWKLQLGYRFNRYLAVEGGFHEFGKVSYDDSSSGGFHSDFNAFAVNADAVGIWPLNDAFSLFGKVGLATSSSKLNGSGPGFRYSASYTNTGISYGVGANWDINSQWAARVEYQIFNKVGGGDNTTDINVWTVGVAYKF